MYQNIITWLKIQSYCVVQIYENDWNKKKQLINHWWEPGDVLIRGKLKETYFRLTSLWNILE